MEIIKKDDYWINRISYYWYGNEYSGSYRGMRYHIHRTPMINLFEKGNEIFRDDPNAYLSVCVWPEPFCFAVTEKKNPESIDKAEFPFAQDSLEVARQWINNKYDERREEFESVMR